MLLAPALLSRFLRGLGPKRAFLYSALWGLAFACVFHLWALVNGPSYWIFLTFFRGLPWLAFPLPALLWLHFSLRDSLWSRVLGTGLGYALVSFLLLSGPSGFDWETPMAALSSRPELLTTLPWLGLSGAAFLLGGISELLSSWERRGVQAGFCLLGLWLMLSWSLHPTLEAQELELMSGVGLVHTERAQEQKWNQDFERELKGELAHYTRLAAEHGSSLVVWPETAWPVRDLRRLQQEVKVVSGLARNLQIEILVSSMETSRDGWFNSVTQVSETGRFVQEYRKRRLVPFGEYVPLPGVLGTAFLRVKPFPDENQLLPGKERVVFESPLGRFAVLICYESMTVGPATEVATEVDFFLVVTNDVSLGWDFAKEAHFRSAILRAAQTRRPVLQASNAGVTGFIASNGAVLTRTSPGQTGAILLDLESGGQSREMVEQR